MGKVSDYSISGLCDADWADDTIDRKSQTSLLVYVEGTLVSWSSKKQDTIARSSTEAEHRAIATTVEELQGVKALSQNWVSQFLCQVSL